MNEDRIAMAQRQAAASMLSDDWIAPLRNQMASSKLSPFLAQKRRKRIRAALAFVGLAALCSAIFWF